MTVAVRTCWEHFAHGADVGIRGVGPTRDDAFQQAALALTGVVADPVSVRPLQAVPIACEAPTDDLLLVDWLNALIYEMATRRMLFGAYAVSIENGRLSGTAWGEPIEPARHQPAVEVKGATYTALRVDRADEDNWVAQCVVDV